MSSKTSASRSASAGWFKSSFSNPDRECVEVRFDDTAVHIRDSKYWRDPANDPASEPIITVRADDWAGFLAEAVGDADPNSNQAVQIVHATDGGVELRELRGATVLAYTPAEWAAFVAGAIVGEFERPGLAMMS